MPLYVVCGRPSLLVIVAKSSDSNGSHPARAAEGSRLNGGQLTAHPSMQLLLFFSSFLKA
jgi:hypothetical protein